MSVEPLAAHLEACAARWREIDANATELQAELDRRAPDAAKASGLRDAVYSARNGAARVVWMRELADTLTAPTRDIQACRHGCSDCCYQGVIIAEPEAQLIAKETGAKLRHPARSQRVGGLAAEAADPSAALQKIAHIREKNSGVPCVFLERGRCRIYASRPVACRKHVSLDRDNLLCKIVPGHTIKAPYLNLSGVDELYQQALPDHWIADIRDWFAR